MKFQKFVSLFTLAIFACFSLFLSSCEEEHTHGPEEHFEPYGLQLRDASKTIFLKVFNGSLDAQYAQEFEVPLNSMTEGFTIEFLDKDGNIVEPPTGSVYSIGFNFSNRSLAEIYQHDGEKYEFHIKGLNLGETELEITFNHNDHVDFRTPKIKVHVEETDELHIHEIKIIDNSSKNILVTIDHDSKVSGTITNEVGRDIFLKILLFDEDGKEVSIENTDYSLMIDYANTINLSDFDATNLKDNLLKITGKQKGNSKIYLSIEKSHDGHKDKIINAPIDFIIN